VSVFIEWPLLAVVPALVLLGLHRLSRHGLTLCAAGAWVLYAFYEFAMHWRWLCSGECNIRVDLLLIYPALALLTLVGIVAAFRRTASS
jgi:hypothetical protein